MARVRLRLLFLPLCVFAQPKGTRQTCAGLLCVVSFQSTGSVLSQSPSTNSDFEGFSADKLEPGSVREGGGAAKLR